MPAASVSRLRLTPCFPRSVGFGPVFLSLKAVLSSWLHPWTTRTSRFPSAHRTRSALFARRLRTRRPRSIRGNVGMPNCTSKSLWRPVRSIGSQCAAETEWHSWHPDPVTVDCGTPKDALCVAAAVVRSVPILCPSSAIRRLSLPVPSRSPINVPMGALSAEMPPTEIRLLVASRLLSRNFWFDQRR